MVETRKLQQIGSTLFVSLPKKWITKMQLKQSDIVTLVPQNDNSISLYIAPSQEETKEIILHISPNDTKESLKRGIRAAYIDGFDVIELKAKERLGEKQHDIIREIISHLFGLELIEITRNTITIQCLLNHDLPVEKTILRIHNVILSMLKETIIGLREQDANLAKGLTKRIDDVKRLSLVTNRLLRSRFIFPRSANHTKITLIDCVDYLQILHIMAEIAENTKKTSESLITLGDQRIPKPILTPLTEIANSIQNLYETALQALLSKDIPLANRVLDSKASFEKLWKLCRNADETSEISSLALSQAYLLIDNLQQIQQYSIEIAEIAIDRTEATIANDHPIQVVS